MAKTASLKYNLASKQQKYTPYELKVVKERNKKRETTTRFNSRYGIYIILPTTSIFLSRPRIHQTIFCRMVHTTKEVAGEKEYITRGGGGRRTKDASPGEICHLTHRWKREWKMTVLEKKLDWENSLYNLRGFSCLFSSFFSSHETRGGTHIVVAASFPMGQPYYTRGKDMSRFIMGIAVAASTSSSIHIRSWVSLSFLSKSKLGFFGNISPLS